IGLENGHCPLCGSPVSEGQFDRHIAEIEKKITQSSGTLSRAVKHEREANQELIQIRRKFVTLESELSASNSIGSALLTQQNALDERAASLGVEPTDTAVARQV